jgi:hypothetical protein
VRFAGARLLPWVMLGVVCAFGCANPDYRADACTDSSRCSGPTPACNLDTLTCVQCTTAESAACGGATPVCGDDQTCRRCDIDAECDSQVCGALGNCLSANEVLYVSPGGMGTECTASQPCMLQTAAAMFTPQRSAIKLFPGTHRGAISVGDNQRLEIHGDGADLTRNDAGPILSAQGLAELAVIGLRIHNATGVGVGSGITCNQVSGNMPSITLQRTIIDRNEGLGIYADSCKIHLDRSAVLSNPGGGLVVADGALTVSRSTISGNIRGGISATYGTFVIVGNVFFGNGNNIGYVGAVSITAVASSVNRLEFNSFAGNRAEDGRGTAIHCLAGTFTARNNIMRDNVTPTNFEQVGGSCAHAYSIVRPGAIPPGPSNSSRDPMFRNAAAGDLHLRAGSPALGAGDPAADLTGAAEFDIDGDRRTGPADIGADEVP